MEEFIDYIIYISQHYGLVMLIMIALIEAILFLIKQPIKLLTKKIPNERLRKLANKVLILLAFGIALGLYVAGHAILPQYVEFEAGKVVTTGAFAIVLYALGDGVVIRTKAAVIDQAAAEITPTINKLANKEKLEKEEVKSAIDSFTELCNSVAINAVKINLLL